MYTLKILVDFYIGLLDLMTTTCLFIQLLWNHLSLNVQAIKDAVRSYQTFLSALTLLHVHGKNGLSLGGHQMDIMQALQFPENILKEDILDMFGGAFHGETKLVKI